MANQWFRLWHDMPNDPKWRTIARVSKRSIPEVVAVYLHVLLSASNATERGRTQSFNLEDVATALDMEEEHVAAIHEAMQGRVLEGEVVTGWNKRQPLKEDGSAERARAWREAQKAAKEEAERDRTKPNDDEHREDKDKDKNKTPPVARAPAVPVQEIIDLYNRKAVGLRKSRVVADPVRRMIAARWKDDEQYQDLEFWGVFFDYCEASDFLTGRAAVTGDRSKPFKASLEWIVKPVNFAKIINGNYKND